MLSGTQITAQNGRNPLRDAKPEIGVLSMPIDRGWFHDAGTLSIE
jgi:hypothetical protein